MFALFMIPAVFFAAIFNWLKALFGLGEVV